MEPKIASISKKLWKIVRVAIFMIKKGLSKTKMFMDLNMMMKRGKIAGKTLRNIMFHHHHFSTSHDGFGGSKSNDGPREYEFSCNNTPSYRHYFTNKRKGRHNNHLNTTQCDDMPSPYPLEKGESVDLEEVNNVLEMMLRNGEVCSAGSTESPALPGLGFGQSPSVRQLRITDSPFPVQNQNSEENKYVDQAAEDFINNFYSQLKQQKYY